MKPAPLLVITSASYVDDALSSEYGRLPNAFLPVGLKRLIAHQIAMLANFTGELVLSLPDDYEITDADAQLLGEHRVGVTRVNPQLALHESIKAVLEIKGGNRPLFILHGDTLFMGQELPLIQQDAFSVAKADRSASWGAYRYDDKRCLSFFNARDTLTLTDGRILSGFFAFSDGMQFLQSLTMAKSFLDALTVYSIQRPLRPVEISGWLDFGHASNFYAARRSLLTSRSFNSITINERVVQKQSNINKKIEHEANWYRQLPDALKIYLPAFLDGGVDGQGNFYYRTEYLPFPTLAELAVYGELGSRDWDLIFQACQQFIEDCTKASVNRMPLTDSSTLQEHLIVAKTESRVAAFLEKAAIEPMAPLSINGRALPPLRVILDTLYSVVAHQPLPCGIMHGDFCFSNIVYDIRTASIRCFDPRGTVDGIHPTIWGSPVYDLAKLAHSVLGGYDYFLAKRFSVTQNAQEFALEIFENPSGAYSRAQFLQRSYSGIEAQDPTVLATTILLFLSMLPLHGDSPERQRGLFANALRLYSDFAVQLN